MFFLEKLNYLKLFMERRFFAYIIHIESEKRLLHRRSMEKEAKANRRRCFMGENCCAYASIETVLQSS